MRLAAPILFTLLPALAAAQQVSGTISGTLDLDRADWTVLEGDGVPSSGWTETDGGTEVEIHAFAETRSPDPETSMTLRFTAAGGATEPTAGEAELILGQIEGQSLEASGRNIDFSLVTYELQGDRLTVGGDIVATLTPGGSDDLVISAGPEDRTFDGSFQATITRAE